MATDETMMATALQLARRAAGRTSPNPLVGAVVVAGDAVVGRGYHAKAGDPHAEVLALGEAGNCARDATLYTTLEPCDHSARTGPCTEAILSAGVRRVVVAMIDPDRRVNGRGIARLRAAGVAVEVGLLEAEARHTNEFYLKHRRTGLPFVCLKWAMSLDGRIAADRTRATAITGGASRQYAHELRNLYDALLVGVQTVLADDPLLTCRLGAATVPAPRNPLRVIVDSRIRTPSTARIIQDLSTAPTLIAATRVAPAERVEAMRQAGVEVLVQGREEGLVDLRALMEELGCRGILSVLIEGGGRVNASALEAGLVDKVIGFVAPRLLGGIGRGAPTPIETDAPGRAGARPEDQSLYRVAIRTLGEDVVIEGYLEP